MKFKRLGFALYAFAALTTCVMIMFGSGTGDLGRMSANRGLPALNSYLGITWDVAGGPLADFTARGMLEANTGFLVLQFQCGDIEDRTEQLANGES